MKTVISFIGVFVCLFSFSSKSTCAKDVNRFIDKALLTPESATLWVTETISVHNGKAQFMLPPQADPKTLRILAIKPQKVGIYGIYYKLVEERKEEQLARLEDQIKALENEIEQTKAKIRAVDKTINGWMAQSKGRFEKSEEAIGFMSALEKAITNLYEKQVLLSKELKDKKKKLRRLKKIYNDTAGSSKKAWEVVCSLKNANNLSSALLSYSFLMKDAGWKPRYFLDAYPKTGKIKFSLRAGIWQHSGSDWKNVDTLIATTEIPESISPPDLPAWIIKVFEPVRMKNMMPQQKMAFMPLQKKGARATTEIKTGYRIYHLGRLDIPAGRTTNVIVESKNWKTKFRYLLRPYVSPWAYVQGKVNFEEEMTLPTASTSLFLEGTYIGERKLDIWGKERIFSFGPDKLVKADMVLEKRETGQAGFFKGKKTFLWKWYFDVSNYHDFDVFVRLEERKPIASDERIEIKEVKLPDLSLAKDSKPDRWTWEFKLKREEKKKFSFLVKVLVPENMEVDPGW